MMPEIATGSEDVLAIDDVSQVRLIGHPCRETHATIGPMRVRAARPLIIALVCLVLASACTRTNHDAVAPSTPRESAESTDTVLPRAERVGWSATITTMSPDNPFASLNLKTYGSSSCPWLSDAFSVEPNNDIVVRVSTDADVCLLDLAPNDEQLNLDTFELDLTQPVTVTFDPEGHKSFTVEARVQGDG